MAKPKTNANAAKSNSKNGDGVDRVYSKMAELADEALLAYALVLGSRVELIQRLPGKRTTESVILNGTNHINEIAHFIFRQWPDKAVKVKRTDAGDPESSWAWKVSGSDGGEAIVFESWSPDQVRKRMKLALAGPEVSGCSPVIEARRKLVWLRSHEAESVVAARRAETVWPPIPGTLRARALELTLASKDFYMWKSSFSSIVVTSKPVLAKLKDPDFYLIDCEEVHYDRKSKANNVAENQVKFDLRFGRIVDVDGSSPALLYEGLATLDANDGSPIPVTKASTKKKA